MISTPAPMSKFSAARRFRDGFTLIELLTVVAIIGVLAAILLPTVGKVRTAARTAHCQSNLRQIAMACQLYSQDTKGLIPRAYGVVLRPSDVVNSANQSGFAAVVLAFAAGQKGGHATTYANAMNASRCPSAAAQGLTAPNGTAVFDYGQNGALPKQRAEGVDGVTYDYPRISQILNPSRVVLASDTGTNAQGTGGLANIALDATGDATFRSEACALRHTQRVNVAFIDGSVRTLGVEELVASRAQGNPLRSIMWEGK